MFDMGVKSVHLARINPVCLLHLSLSVQNHGMLSVKNEGKEVSFFKKGKIEFQCIYSKVKSTRINAELS